jgi:FolB domain-containing protein
VTANGLVEIALVGMRFHVRVGILPHEHEHAQPLEIDLTVRHRASRSSVLDYRGLYDAVRLRVENGPLRYLEALAEEIASDVLTMDDVVWCRLVIKKPHVALGGPLAYALVAVERSRE